MASKLDRYFLSQATVVTAILGSPPFMLPLSGDSQHHMLNISSEFSEIPSIVVPNGYTRHTGNNVNDTVSCSGFWLLVTPFLVNPWSV